MAIIMDTPNMLGVTLSENDTMSLLYLLYYPGNAMMLGFKIAKFEGIIHHEYKRNLYNELIFNNKAQIMFMKLSNKAFSKKL